MVTAKLGRCPRCGGNMLLSIDLDGWYEECLQCSFWRELRDVMVKSDMGLAQTKAETTLEAVEDIWDESDE